MNLQKFKELNKTQNADISELSQVINSQIYDLTIDYHTNDFKF